MKCIINRSIKQTNETDREERYESDLMYKFFLYIIRIHEKIIGIKFFFCLSHTCLLVIVKFKECKFMSIATSVVNKFKKESEKNLA